MSSVDDQSNKDTTAKEYAEPVEITEVSRSADAGDLSHQRSSSGDIVLRRRNTAVRQKWQSIWRTERQASLEKNSPVVIVLPTRLTKILLVLLALLLAVVAVLAILLLRKPSEIAVNSAQAQRTVEAQPSATVTASPAETTPSPSPPPASPSQAPQASLPTIWFQGPLAVDPDGKDLDLNPPAETADQSSEDLTYNIIDGGLYPAGNATIAQWQGNSIPTYSQCAQAASADSVDKLSPPIGSYVCVRTNDGRIARLEVTGYGTGTQYDYFFTAVIWNLPNAQS